MLCKLQNVKKLCLRVASLPILSVSIAAMVWTPIATAQTSSSEERDGIISGTVLLKAGNRPASQVAVKLKSHAAGIFRSILTDYEGHFEVRNLPPSTYEIMVDEPGYEPARTSTELDGTAAKLVLYLNPSNSPPAERNRYTVSARELSIPGKARSEYEKGVERLRKRDLAGSLGHFTKAAQAFPEYYEAYYHVGVVKTNLGQFDEAMRAFLKAVDLSGGRYAWADFGIGYVLFLQGKPEDAETAVRRGLELDSSSPDAYVILGMAQLRLDRADEAERSAREALLRNPNFGPAYLVLSDAYGRKHEYQAQLQGLDTYLKLEPNTSSSERVRQAREAVQKMATKAYPQE